MKTSKLITALSVAGSGAFALAFIGSAPVNAQDTQPVEAVAPPVAQEPPAIAPDGDRQIDGPERGLEARDRRGERPPEDTFMPPRPPMPPAFEDLDLNADGNVSKEEFEQFHQARQAQRPQGDFRGPGRGPRPEFGQGPGQGGPGRGDCPGHEAGFGPEGRRGQGPQHGRFDGPPPPRRGDHQAQNGFRGPRGNGDGWGPPPRGPRGEQGGQGWGPPPGGPQGGGDGWNPRQEEPPPRPRPRRYNY